MSFHIRIRQGIQFFLLFLDILIFFSFSLDAGGSSAKNQPTGVEGSGQYQIINKNYEKYLSKQSAFKSNFYIRHLKKKSCW